jgi:arginase family enzyme
MTQARAPGPWDSGLATIDSGAVGHAGARFAPGDFDEAGHREAERSEMAMIGVDAELTDHVLGRLANSPVYVHLDPDVLDPQVNPVAYGRPGGLDADQLVGLLGAVAARGPVLGLEVTAYHTPDDPDGRAGVTQLLGEAVSALLA